MFVKELLEDVSQQDIFQKINALKAEIDVLRPLSPEQENKIMQKFRLDWNYHSNAIEGNSVNYGETVAFLMNGITAKGKPFKDYLDIRGHDKAINFLTDIIKSDDHLTEKDIRSLHEIMLDEPYETQVQSESGLMFMKKIKIGQYKQFTNHVITQTGETHYYASPEETPFLMQDLVNWYNDNINNDSIHPVVLAAAFHYKFVSIHPFDDGNGRMTRLLMNLILLKKGFVPVVVKTDSKADYYLYLSEADAGNINPFIIYIADNLVDSLTLYLKGARGENIDEPSDLDKKLLLFRREIEGREDKIETKRSLEAQIAIRDNSFLLFLKKYSVLINKFIEFFFEIEDYQLLFTSRLTGSKRWVYVREDILTAANMFLEVNDTDDIFVFATQLRRFKVESNPFNIEVKISLELKDYYYLVKCNVSKIDQFDDFPNDLISLWMDSYSIKKYYHQKIESIEIDYFMNTLGEFIYEYIQNSYKNPNYYRVSLEESQVANLWVEYKLSDSIYSEYLKNIYTDQVVNVEGDDRIIINMKEVDYKPLSEFGESIEWEFSQFIYNKLGLNGKVFPVITWS